jgi:hypothetical protein
MKPYAGFLEKGRGVIGKEKRKVVRLYAQFPEMAHENWKMGLTAQNRRTFCEKGGMR